MGAEILRGLFSPIRLVLGNVYLSKDEVSLAERVGRLRNQHSKSMGLEDTYGLGVTSEDNEEDFWGAAGELACAKLQGIPWPGEKTWEDWSSRQHVHEVGDLYGHEVRTTKPGNRRLILHRSDNPDACYILVWGQSRFSYRVVGWCYARDGQRQEFWQEGTGRPCYFVPASALNTESSDRRSAREYFTKVLEGYGVVLGSAIEDDDPLGLKAQALDDERRWERSRKLGESPREKCLREAEEYRQMAHPKGT